MIVKDSYKFSKSGALGVSVILSEKEKLHQDDVVRVGDRTWIVSKCGSRCGCSKEFNLLLTRISGSEENLNPGDVITRDE